MNPMEDEAVEAMEMTGLPTPPCYGQEVPADFPACAGCELAAACYDAYESGPHPMGCVCDDHLCQICDPDPDALDFARLLRQGMTPREAAEVKDVESMTFKQWQAVYA
jgi:hypothetical protein